MTTDSGAPLVAGRGEAIDVKRNQFDAAARAGTPAGEGPRAAAEAALAAIRYADPASWATATAVAHAIAAERDAVLAAHDRVGVIVTSAEGPVEAMAAMNEAAKSGSSSPIRYPASNAGSLAGIPTIGFTFRGPTLMLTLPADRGAPVGLLLADAWLRRGHADYVVLAACGRVADGKPAARCLLLAAAGKAGVALDHDGAASGPMPQAGRAVLDRDRDAAWLAAQPEAST
jgi:hypothetical protein